MVLCHQRCTFGVITKPAVGCGHPQMGILRGLFALLPLHFTFDTPGVQVRGGLSGLSRSTLARRRVFWFIGGWIILFCIPRSSQLCTQLFCIPRTPLATLPELWPILPCVIGSSVLSPVCIYHGAFLIVVSLSLFWRPAFKVIKSQRIAAFPKMYADMAQKFSVIGKYLKSLFKLQI